LALRAAPRVVFADVLLPPLRIRTVVLVAAFVSAPFAAAPRCQVAADSSGVVAPAPVETTAFEGAAGAPVRAAVERTSYWGSIPPPSDSTRATFRNRSRSAWEWPLIVPYSVVNLPLRWIRHGVGATVSWAERRDWLRYINIAPVPKGLVPNVGYSSQEGLLLGLDYYNHINEQTHLYHLRGQYSTEHWRRFTGGVLLNNGHRYEFQVGVGHRVRPNLEYYGIGPETDSADLSYYEEERNWAGAGARARLRRSVVAAFVASYSEVGTRLPREGNEPTVIDVFPDIVDAPGFDTSSDGVMARAALVLDTSEREGNPEHGTIVGGSVGAFQSTNQSDVSFVAYRCEVQQFVGLWHAGRALAVRVYCNWLDNTGGLPIPFQRLFINESPDMFRGYDKGRWRDRGITGTTLEYRFPLVADRPRGGFGIDTALFTDIGQVFGELDEISTERLTYTYGFGFRGYMGKYFSGAVEFAWAEEGFRFRISTKQAFQFSRDVLYRGREETLIH
jgi:hypothetical protein